MTANRSIAEFLSLPPTFVPAGFPDLTPDRSYHDVLINMLIQATRIRRQVREQERLFEELLRDVEAASAEELRSLADEIEVVERSQAAVYVPALQDISDRLPAHRRRRSDRDARSMARIGEEIIDIGRAWLELFQNTRLRFLRLASIRDGEPPSPTFADADAAMEHLRRALAG
jgi:hypothetical protein